MTAARGNGNAGQGKRTPKVPTRLGPDVFGGAWDALASGEQGMARAAGNAFGRVVKDQHGNGGKPSTIGPKGTV